MDYSSSVKVATIKFIGGIVGDENSKPNVFTVRGGDGVAEHWVHASDDSYLGEVTFVAIRLIVRHRVQRGMSRRVLLNECRSSWTPRQRT
jgi:hypothetical protein